LKHCEAAYLWRTIFQKLKINYLGLAGSIG
jgi:hypothetical protein